MLIINFIMSDLPVESMRLRPKSTQSRNYKNIQLHACLDEAKLYQDRVMHHFSVSKFQNHTLQSAERVYEKDYRLNPSRSSSAFRRSSSDLQKKSNGETKSMARTGSRFQRNPEVVLDAFEEKTLRISKIKSVFDDDTAEKHQLKKRMQQLKRLIVIEKNKKAKISLNNSKLMNENVLSNYQISKLMEQSRRTNILIDEVENDVDLLSQENNNLMLENSLKENEIKKLHHENNNLQQFVAKTKRNLMNQRKLLEEIKQAQTISYKEMTNSYMVVNQRKEEKALLLNAIEIDVANNS